MLKMIDYSKSNFSKEELYKFDEFKLLDILNCLQACTYYIEDVKDKEEIIILILQQYKINNDILEML